MTEAGRCTGRGKPVKCPICGLINPATSELCDCGYEFATRTLKRRPSGDKKDFPSARAWRKYAAHALRREISPYPSLGQAVFLIVLWSLGFLALLALAGVFNPGAMLASGGFSWPVLWLSAWAIIIVYGCRKARSPVWEIFPFRTFNPALLLPMGVCFVGLYIASSELFGIALVLLPPPPAFLSALTDFGRTPEGLAGSAFGLVLVAPLTEEFFFRGLVLHSFLRRYSPTKAIILSAVLFGLSHLDPWQVAYTPLWGLVAAWWVVETDSLLAPLAGHALINALVIAPAIFGLRQGSVASSAWGGMPLLPTWLAIAGALILAGGAAWLDRSFKRYGRPKTSQPPGETTEEYHKGGTDAPSPVS